MCASRPGLHSSVISSSTQLYCRCIWDLPMLFRCVQILPCDYLTFATITTDKEDSREDSFRQPVTMCWPCVLNHHCPASEKFNGQRQFTPVSLPTCLLPEPRPKVSVWYSPLLVTSSDVFDGATSSIPLNYEDLSLSKITPVLHFVMRSVWEQFKSWFNTLSPIWWELS